MKKIFALLLSVAMVASLFIPVAFAAVAAPSVRLNVTSTISTGDHYGTFTVTGMVVDANGVLINQDLDLTFWGASATVPVYTGKAYAGRINFMIPTNVAPVAYTVKVENATYATDVITPATFTVKYNVTLANALTYPFSATAQTVVQGTVKDGAGVVKNGAAVTLKYIGGATIASATTNALGQFGFIVNGWSAAGKIGLYVNDVLHLEGEVTALPMTLTASPNTGLVHTISNSKIKFNITGGPASGSLVWTIKKGTTDVSANALFNTLHAQNALTSAGKLVDFEFVTDFEGLGAGTYTFTAKANDGKYAASATVTVISASKFNFVDTNGALKEFIIGDNTITFDDNNIRVIETNPDGTEKVQAETYKVFVNGEEKALNASNQLVINTKTLGTVEIKVVAYVGTIKIYETTVTVPVAGWDATYDVTTLTVGEKKTITFIVKDKDGNPVNNAVIWFQVGTDAAVRMTSPFAGVQNGVYVIKDVTSALPLSYNVTVNKVDTTAPLTVMGAKMASFTAGVKVLGEKVYTVTADATTLLVGKSQKVVLTIADASGAFIPDRVEVQVGTGAAAAQIATPKDLNSDGIYDAIEVTLLATGTKDITVRPTNATATKMGEVVLKVVAPTLVVTGNQYATENIYTLLTFKVVDPRTNAVLTQNITLGKTHATTVSLKDTFDRALDLTLIGSNEYEVKAIVTGAAYKAATDAKEEVAITVGIDLDAAEGALTPVAGTYLVKPATLKSNPESIIIGLPANLTLTYADANGNVIAGKMVNLEGGAEIGKTNVDGQVLYAVAQGATTAVKFTALTDVTNVVTELAVKSTFDSAAPVVTAPATVDGTTAVITIKDNVRVTRLMVNGAEVNFFPMATVNHVVTVKSGVNTFAVIAMDANYNVIEKVVTITSTVAPAFVPVVISIGKANPAIGLDVAAVAKNGRLMVPFRWFGEKILGATVDYTVIGTAEVVTLVKGTTSVELTLNSVIAKVNGVAVTLDVAAYAEGGRTLVPARFLAETFGYTIVWDGATNNVTISK